MSVEVNVLADSLTAYGDRLTTFSVRVPRVVWSEVMTHRAFSRNASSSRAIPVTRLIQDVLDDPYIPERFGLKQKGMQPGEFVTAESDPYQYNTMRYWWLRSRDRAVENAREGVGYGLHKQVVNRLLEPFQHINAVISATDWDNFIRLRTEVDDKGNPMADIPIYQLATEVDKVLRLHDPTRLEQGQWHIPFAGGDGWDNLSFSQKLQVAIARCARVSYVTHDLGKLTMRGFDEDIKLFNRLKNSEHLSPFEHVAYATSRHRFANFKGFRSYRRLMETSIPDDETVLTA